MLVALSSESPDIPALTLVTHIWLARKYGTVRYSSLEPSSISAAVQRRMPAWNLAVAGPLDEQVFGATVYR